MKKSWMFCAALALLCAAWVSALANGWGLSSGRLLAAVSRVHTWDDYTLVGNAAGDFAVLGTQYHNALFWADEAGTLHVYTTAVYQPGDKKAPPRLTLEGDTLTIAYGQSESYTFARLGDEYQLTEAKIGDFRLYAVPLDDPYSEMVEYSWYCEDAEGTAYYGWRLPLNAFNISLLPHSTAEARAIQWMRAKLDSGTAYLAEGYSADYRGQSIATGRTGAAPVYSAPAGASAWRAAKGKAAVGLNGEIWLLNEYLDSDGRSWAMIRYDVSQRTQRIGYALCGDLGLERLTEQDHDAPGYSFARVDVVCAADTYLTDDPDVGQYRQAELPRGTDVTCMGLYNDYYAYVGLEVNKNDRPTDGGAILWGFVPIKDLRPMEEPVLQDVMARMTGYWYFYAGGNQAEDFLLFNENGTFTACNYDYTKDESEQPGDLSEWEHPVTGVWYVTAYRPFENLYWDQPPYELTLLYDDGRVNIKGLTLNDTGFSLTYWEGGGGYCPVGYDPWDSDPSDTNG